MTKITDEMVQAAVFEFSRPCKGLGLESMNTKARRCLEAALASQGKVVSVGADEFSDKAERALSELIDKIIPGLDTGDIIADAGPLGSHRVMITEDEIQNALDIFYNADLNGSHYPPSDHSAMRAALEAALSRQGKVVAVEKLKELCDKWDRHSKAYSGTVTAGSQQLRALIGEDHG